MSRSQARSTKFKIVICALVIGLSFIVFVIFRNTPKTLAPLPAAAQETQDRLMGMPPLAPIEQELRSLPLASQTWASLPLAERLNNPLVPVDQDVQTVFSICDIYFTSLKTYEGRPIRDDSDLVIALSGKNPIKRVFLPPNHPAISAEGRLLDRWGTPYFIHALKSRFLEIRSGGPDRKLFTHDDLIAPPPLPESSREN